MIFRYTITLIDPVFYSQEGLSGAVTPPYLHATAVNHAVLYALGDSEAQPYIMHDQNGGRNIPRYESSLISHDFYFTPARLKSTPRYLHEIVKGDRDDFIQKVYQGAEILRSSYISYIAQESQFEGYGICKNNLRIPEMIRLGSFRGVAKINLSPGKYIKRLSNALADHPVDPIVTKVKRGIIINIFPYPFVENAVCEDCLEIKIEGDRFKTIVSLPAFFSTKDVKKIEISEGDTLII
ncbi:MAG: type I-D CRISPR-associated protein Cas5/Csc1 [Deltaproteobacteria bacterium]|nr:type I-D CRISPR-associated protein Cas5/Csc1 [Deltaproteobacteria bacterium]